MMSQTAKIIPGAFLVFACAQFASAEVSRNILLTGYWPPTNEMLREFSIGDGTATDLINWSGNNWEGRGFNIYSYFPEFPDGVTSGRGTGDFEVDYQDTAADWARVVNDLQPTAIITFSRGNTSNGWQLEPAAQRFRLPNEVSPPDRTIPFYAPDYGGVRYPSNVPIASEPVGTVRMSSLPMGSIVTEVAEQFAPEVLSPFISDYNPAHPDAYDYGGSFLSGYISYLGNWYHDTHAGPDVPFQNLASGHIHVGYGVDEETGRLATEATLRVLTDHLAVALPAPGTIVLLGMGALGLTRRRR